MHSITQQSGMGYGTGGAGVVGCFGIVSVDVDRLDCAGEGNQQNAQRAQKLKAFPRMRLVSRFCQTEMPLG
jgi:hypothetical protein